MLCFKNSCLCISQWLLGLVVEVFPVYSESLFHRGFLAHHQWTMNHPWLDGAFRWSSSRCHWSHAAPWWIFVGNSLDVPLGNGTPDDNMQVWKLPNDPVESTASRYPLLAFLWPRYELFNRVGPVASIRVCRDKIKKKSLGYGYVTWQKGFLDRILAYKDDSNTFK